MSAEAEENANIVRLTVSDGTRGGRRGSGQCVRAGVGRLPGAGRRRERPGGRERPARPAGGAAPRLGEHHGARGVSPAPDLVRALATGDARVITAASVRTAGRRGDAGPRPRGAHRHGARPRRHVPARVARPPGERHRTTSRRATAYARSPWYRRARPAQAMKARWGELGPADPAHGARLRARHAPVPGAAGHRAFQGEGRTTARDRPRARDPLTGRPIVLVELDLGAQLAAHFELPTRTGVTTARSGAAGLGAGPASVDSSSHFGVMASGPVPPIRPSCSGPGARRGPARAPPRR